MNFFASHHNLHWILNGNDYPAQEADTVGTVDHSVVVRKRQWKHHAGFELAVDIHRFDPSP